MSYEVVKAVHIISVISFMAGMLYLPRLFVYHSKLALGSDAYNLFVVMEKRLLRFIINPALIVMTITGVALIIQGGWGAPGGQKWIHAKLGLMVLMYLAHGFAARYRKAFERGKNLKSEKFFRIYNEIPTVLMILIVFLVVLKPF